MRKAQPAAARQPYDMSEWPPGDLDRLWQMVTDEDHRWTWTDEVHYRAMTPYWAAWRLWTRAKRAVAR